MKLKYLVILSSVLICGNTFSQANRLDKRSWKQQYSQSQEQKPLDSDLKSLQLSSSPEGGGTENESEIETIVMTIDLNEPGEKSVSMSNGKKRLQILSRQLLAVKLINGNPFRYDYKLNYKTINLFNNNENLPDLQDQVNNTRTAETEEGGFNGDPESGSILRPQENQKRIKKDFKVLLDSLTKVNDRMEMLIAKINGYNELVAESTNPDYFRIKRKQRRFERLKSQHSKAWNQFETLLDTKGKNNPKYLEQKKRFERNNVIFNRYNKDLDLLLNFLEVGNSMRELRAEIDLYFKLIKNTRSFNYNEFDKKRKGFKIDFEKYLMQWNSYSQNRFYDDTIELAALTKAFKEDVKNIQQDIESLFQLDEKPYLLPIDVNGDNIDYIEIELEIFDKITNTTRKYTYKVWIKGGLKIDFSGGTVITSLFDKEYTTNSIEDDPTTMDIDESGTAIRELDNGDYDFGFGAMVNISIRWGGSWVKPSLSIGAMFSSEQKFQLMTGFGLILGKNDRFILHGGLAMGQVNTLRSSLIADGQTSNNLTNGSSITNTKFEFGHFFGISYNFGKPKGKIPAQ